LRLEQAGQELADLRLVVDDEDSLIDRVGPHSTIIGSYSCL